MLQIVSEYDWDAFDFPIVEKMTFPQVFSNKNNEFFALFEGVERKTHKDLAAC